MALRSYAVSTLISSSILVNRDLFSYAHGIAMYSLLVGGTFLPGANQVASLAIE